MNTPAMLASDISSGETSLLDSLSIASSAIRETHVPFSTDGEFLPFEPTTLEESKLSYSDVSGLILKYLLNVRYATGRRIAEQIRLPFRIVQEILLSLKSQMLISYRNSALVTDYEHELTNAGSERAREFAAHTTYCGSAPVTFDDYFVGIKRQSFRSCRPRMSAIRNAYSDLLVNDEVLAQLGQAANAGRGLFIFGAPGNGKSVIAERLVRTVGDYIWIPRTLAVSGDVIRLFDPSTHEEVPLEPNSELLRKCRIDQRWVRIRRPTVIVGGELTLQNLEVTFNPARGTNEAPLQLKSNCGVLVIDDFGRQRASTRELLDRFIIPLEKGCDYVSLPTGRQIQVPFDQMLVFSTNLTPESLCDEAFMRRIPYKIEAIDPTEQQFRALFRTCAEQHGLRLAEHTLEYIVNFYRASQRPFRFCHPRDLLAQIRTFCDFFDVPFEVSPNTFSIAVKNYFTGM